MVIFICYFTLKYINNERLIRIYADYLQCCIEVPSFCTFMYILINKLSSETYAVRIMSNFHNFLWNYILEQHLR